jgi:hypothetical protein
VSGDRLWSARAPTLAGDLNFRSQRSEGDWLKLAWGLAKVALFLRWPAGLASLASLAGLWPGFGRSCRLKPAWELALADEACEDRFCGDLSTSQLQRLFNCVPLGSMACLRLK